MSGLDIGIIVFYMAGMLFIGIYSGKKQQDSDDYFVAGRKAGVFSITCLWLSSWIGGASIVGTAERAYSMGITAVWYVVVIAVSLVIFAFTFTGTIKRLSTKLNLLTYPDFIESRYDSKTRMVATICTILGMIGFVASQFLAGGSTLSALTGWDSKVSLIVVAAVITFYTAFGGLLAVTYTDWVQTVITSGYCDPRGSAQHYAYGRRYISDSVIAGFLYESRSMGVAKYHRTGINDLVFLLYKYGWIYPVYSGKRCEDIQKRLSAGCCGNFHYCGVSHLFRTEYKGYYA